jgi:hypothetical protein
MQDKKLINVSQAVIGEQGVYSIEFHEDQHYTHVKRVNSDGTASYFSVGGSGGGTTYTAGTGIDITNGVISSTVVDTDTTYTAGTGINISNGVISSTVGSYESNIVPFLGAQVDTDTVSIYGIRQSTQRIVLTRTLGTDVDFVLQGGTADLGTGNYGFLTVKVVLDITGFGGVRLHYKDLSNNNVHVLSGTALTSGEIAITFGYFGTTGLQLINATLL